MTEIMVTTTDRKVKHGRLFSQQMKVLVLTEIGHYDSLDTKSGLWFGIRDFLLASVEDPKEAAKKLDVSLAAAVCTWSCPHKSWLIHARVSEALFYATGVQEWADTAVDAYLRYWDSIGFGQQPDTVTEICFDLAELLINSQNESMKTTIAGILHDYSTTA